MERKESTSVSNLDTAFAVVGVMGVTMFFIVLGGDDTFVDGTVCVCDKEGAEFVFVVVVVVGCCEGGSDLLVGVSCSGGVARGWLMERFTSFDAGGFTD